MQVRTRNCPWIWTTEPLRAPIFPTVNHRAIVPSLLLASTLCWADSLSTSAVPVRKDSTKVLKIQVVPIHGEIDEGLEHFVKRAIDDAVAAKPDLIVFDIDTWGGRLDAAFEISDAITSIKPCSTAAFVARKAISAGALIALSTHRVYMAPGATIGDCAPILQGEQGPIFVGEKVESPLRARFRSLARRSHLPPELAEKMVSKDLAALSAVDSAGNLVWFSQESWEGLDDSARARYHGSRTEVAEGQLLTLDDQEALKWGFSGGTFADISALETAQGWTESKRLDPTWSETSLRWLSNYVSILFVLGLAGIYLEYKMPGTGIFGIAGALFLALALGSQFLLGMASYTALILAGIGVLLVALEILLFPGTVVLALVGLGCLLVALVFSLQGFALPDPKLPWQAIQMRHSLITVLSTALGAGVLSVAAVRWLVPLLPFREGPYLQATLKDLPESTPLASDPLTGTIATVRSTLRPVGSIDLDGVEHPAISITGMLSAGSRVRITGKRGNEFLVEPADES
jgi:membrane-bound serine protease (ClpP class)